MGIYGSFISPFHRIPHSPMRKTVETAKKLSSFSVEESTGKKRATKEKNWFNFLFSLPGGFYKSLSEYFISNEPTSPSTSEVKGNKSVKATESLFPKINQDFCDSIRSETAKVINTKKGIEVHENVDIYGAFWRDLGRTDINLIDETGKTIEIRAQTRVDVENRAEEEAKRDGKKSLDEIGKQVTTAVDNWKNEQVNKLKSFFGYVESKGSADLDNKKAAEKLYLISINCGQAFNASFLALPQSPQKFEGNNISIPARNSHPQKQLYTILKDRQNNCSLTYEESTTFDSILNLEKAQHIKTDKSQSKIDQKIGIVLKDDNTFEPYEDGYYRSKIVIAKEQEEI